MIALLAGISASACLLTRGVFDAAFDRYPDMARITRVRGAATDGGSLFLQLDVQERGEEVIETVLLKIPIEDIGKFRGATGPGLKLESVDLGAPPMGCFEPTTSLPSGAAPLPVSYLVFDTFAEFQRHVDALSPGVYVAIVHGFEIESSPSGTLLPEDGSVPGGARLTIVANDQGGGSRWEFLYGFTEAPRKRPAWLLLTPLAVAGDIVTAPLQIIAGVIIGC